MPPTSKLQSVKELAPLLRVSEQYLRAMRRAGAPFYGRLAYESELIAWWKKNRNFRFRKNRVTKRHRL
jgi:hypothetical protein